MLLRLVGLILSTLPALLPQTQVDLRTQAKRIDFSAASSTRPVKTGTALPALCSDGDLFFRTTAAPGQNLFGCTATNTWVQLSGGGSTTAWNDLRIVRVSSSTLTIGDTCSSTTPCTVRFGSTVIPIQNTMSATISAGSGNGLARIYLTEAGVVLVDHALSAGLTVSCTAGCTAQQSVAPEFPPNSVPLGEVLISAGSWNSVTDLRSVLHNRAMTAGQGIAITELAGVATVEIDTADVPRLGGANDWTGANDFSAASTFRMRTGAGVPAASECSAAAHVGRLYVRSDASGANASFYVCSNNAPGGYAWETPGGGSGSSAPDCMVEGNVCLKDEFPYIGSATGGYSELNWKSNGTPGYADWFNSGSRIGVVRLSPSGADAVSSLFQDAGASNGGYVNPSQISAFEIVLIWQPDTLSANYQYAAGVSSDGTMGGASAAIFRLADSTACATNFSDNATLQYLTRNSGTATVATSGVSVQAGQWLKTRLRKLAGETQFRFSVSVNGGAYSTETTVATNLPAAGLTPFFQVTSCDGNAQRLYIDYFRFAATGVAR